jgi:5-methyltetrahydrofolate--homocysteine methyltransferase
LITPSLDEMSHLAKELEREGFDIPLLIGGATTSRAHTAVKIEPHYHGEARWSTCPTPPAASPSPPTLLSPSQRDGFLAEVKKEYAALREQHAGKKVRVGRISLAAARANRAKIDWSNYHPKKPSFLGVRAFERYPLSELVPRIDWTPFFQTWELVGRYPDILEDEVVGEQARELHRDALAMLDRIVRDGSLEARAVLGFSRPTPPKTTWRSTPTINGERCRR